MSHIETLVGKRFGRLAIIDEAPRGKKNRIQYLAICDCGKRVLAIRHRLQSGDKKSCGCLIIDKTRAMGKRGLRHGHAVRSGTRVSTKTYRTWLSMMARCNNPKLRGYHRYGGRGISVDSRWLVFANFLADMGEKPEGKSLDRINNDGNYEPGNCRWATAIEQNSNTSQNVFWEHAGQRLTVAEWARRIGMSRAGLEARVKRAGMTIGQALTTTHRCLIKSKVEFP